MNWSRAHISLLIYFFAICVKANAYTNDTGMWLNASALPIALQEIYADTLEGKIYVAGGIKKGDEASDQFFVFDPELNTWSSLSKLPEARHHITLSTFEDSIYGVGGFTGSFPNWVAQKSVYLYEIKDRSWSLKTELTIPRGEHVSEVVNGELYVIGGRIPRRKHANHFNDYIDTPLTERYDPKSNQWQRLADAPSARNSAASVVINNKIYVVGGRSNSILDNGEFQIVNSNQLEVYDPIINNWQTLEPMPQAQGGLSAATFEGKLYAFGGEQWSPKEKVFNNAWVYDPDVDSWSKVTPLPTPRHGTTAVTLNGKAYVIGGANNTGVGPVNIIEVLDIKN